MQPEPSTKAVVAEPVMVMASVALKVLAPDMAVVVGVTLPMGVALAVVISNTPPVRGVAPIVVVNVHTLEAVEAGTMAM